MAFVGYFGLQRIEGPVCPDCGCEASQVVKASEWLGKIREKRECAHCGKVWTISAKKYAEEPPKR